MLGTFLLIMDLIERIELKVKKSFEIESLKQIEKGKKEYHNKYPFVKKIYCGMGGTLPVDADDISTFEINWKQLDKIIAENPKKDEDDLFDDHLEFRRKSYNDEFIMFLTNLQYHDLGFCPNDIVFNCA